MFSVSSTIFDSCVCVFRSNPEAYELLRNGQIIEGLNRFDWTQPNIVQDLEDSVLHSSIQTMCHSESVSFMPRFTY